MSTTPEDQGWRAKVRGSALGNIIVLVVTALVLGGVWLIAKPDASADATEVDVQGSAVLPEVGSAPPDFTTVDIEGNEIALADFEGEPVWLVFMATWCSGCRAEVPDVQEIHETRDDVNVVAVYLREGEDTVADFADRLGLTFTHISDPQATLNSAYGVRAVPTHVFIDDAGVVRHTYVGVMGMTQIEEALASIR